MTQRIILNSKTIDYKIRSSQRARYLSVAVNFDSDVIVTVPRFFDQSRLEKFLTEKAGWILSKIAYFQKRPGLVLSSPRNGYLQDKREALMFVQSKVEQFNKIYSFPYKKIAIKNQKTRWGSCSKAGNLNINYKIIFLPEDMANYLIVHELCHLKEFNHSRAFWELVAKTIPNYKVLRKKIQHIRWRYT